MRIEQPVTLSSLGAAARGANSDITSLSGLTSVVGTTAGAVTAGTLTVANSAQMRTFLHKFSWTNAMVAALGAATTGNITVCTLPAKTVVRKATIVITGQAGTLTGLTVSLGRVATAYIDYIVASNAKATANTVYGDTIAEVGTGLSAILGDLPSLSGTTAVNLQFISAVEDLSNVTGSAGDIYLETQILP